MRVMILGTIALLAAVSASRAGPAEEEVFAAFEFFCLDQLAEPARAADKLADIGIKELPADKARILLEQPGRAWLVPGTSTRFAVMLSEVGVCTAYGPDIEDHEAALTAFKQNTKSRELNREAVGSTMEYLFATTVSDTAGGDDQHAIVTVKYSNLRSIPGLFFVSIPEALAKSDGITLPPWP